MKLDYDPVVDVRSVDMAEKGAVCEITKYAVKGEFLSDVCPQEQAVRVVTVLANTLRNRRLIGFGGLFRDVRKFLKQEDVETGISSGSVTMIQKRKSVKFAEQNF